MGNKDFNNRSGDDKLINSDELSSSERKKILVDWNDTAAPYPKDKTIYQLFEEQVKKTPDNITVVFEDVQLSYKELNKKSNQLAHLIRDKYKKQNKKDLKPDSLIGLCVERSLDMIIGILGILKAGAAYVPLDPDYPQDRLEYMIEDSHEGLIITQKDVLSKDGFLDKLHHDELLVIDSDEVKAELSKQSTENLDSFSGPNDLAYVIYTSGSTGKPKGTMLEHRGVVNQITWIKENHKYVSNDIFLNLTTYAFDASVRQIFVPLISGACVVIPNSIEAKDTEAWARLMMDNQVSRFYMVPTALRGFIDYIHDSDLNKEAFSKLSMIGCGGEALSSNLLHDVVSLFPDVVLLNQYGPTEASANVMQWHANLEELEKRYPTPPIGKAIGNINIYVLGNSQELLPIGAPGELYIGGIGLSRGYLNKKEITSERFIPNPFAKELGLPESDKIYKTGDLVRWLPDGNIEYLGRTDFQVKIRGFRIELGEIENVLAKHENISQVSVIDKEKEGQKYLAAFYVISKGKKEPEIDDLRSYLSETLPDYMVPAAFVKLDAMPLTPNGKIDRKALPDPDMSLMGEEYIEPSSEIEQKLAQIWGDVLKIDANKIGIHDDFFNLGGHSLLATQLISRVHAKLNCDISIKNLFDNPKLIDFASFIDNQIKEGVGEVYSTINKVERLKEGSPLSSAQERLWFLDQYEEGSSSNYNIPLAIKLEGNLNCNALEQAINQLIARHDSLRTVFHSISGVPLQLVLPKITISLSCQDVNKKDLISAIDKDANESFDLSTGPLIRAQLFKVSGYYVLYINQHHIISDGWSQAILIRELSELYSANINNSKPRLEPLKTQYIDFAVWQREGFTAKKEAKGVQYWCGQLENHVPLDLPLDKSRPAIQTKQGSHYNISLDNKKTKLLNSLCEKEKATLSMTLLTAYQLLLGRLSGQNDVLVGMAVANRNHKDTEVLIGFFVNTLPMRLIIDKTDSFSTLLQKTKIYAINAYEYQDIPFEKIVDAVNIERVLDRMPLVQHMFVMQNANNQVSLDLPCIDASKFEISNLNTSKFDIILECTELEEKLLINIEYSKDIYSKNSIQRLANQFIILLEQITKNPQQSVIDYVLMTEDERRNILIDWNDTAAPYPKDKTIYKLFEEQVKQAPDNIAVVFEEEKLSYKELNKKSNQLSHLIRAKYKKQNKKDLKPDSLIGLCVERSLDMIIGILGILKAGGAYVPLDPDYPQERLEYMIEDSHEGLIITQNNVVAKDGFLDKLHHDELLVIDSDEVKAELSKQSTENLDSFSGPNDLAYVIYTSGSTGRPKGVMVEHKSVNRLVCNANYISFCMSDRVLQSANISFDAATFEIWGALLNGLTLVQINENNLLNISFFKTFLENHQISIMWMTAALFNQYVAQDPSIFSKLKYLLVGGEALSPGTISQLLANKAGCPKYLLNGYGPTENTTFTTTFSIKKYYNNIPIGTQINNTTCYILNSNLRLCPIGVPGELYIGGEGLARGYLNQEELTRERFIPNPFAKELGLSKSDRIYKTGDLVRWLPDGNIEYIGRTDFQVKIRGYRIELGEIENALAKHEDISQVIVIAKEGENQKYLVAYYVIEEDKKDLGINDLRDYLSTILADYMVPSAFVKLDQMPLTANGKIDRKALPDPDMSVMGEDYVAPGNEIEKKLANIWADILKIDNDKIGIHDNFFHLGGHSLLATQLISRIHAKLNCDITIKKLFDKPKLIDLALHVERKTQAGATVSYEPIKKNKILKSGNIMSYSQESLWFLDQFEGANKNYNIPIIFTLKGRLDVAALEKSLNQLIARHASFRTVFAKDKSSGGVQKIVDKIEIDLLAEQFNTNNLQQALKDEVKKEINRTFDLESGPLIRVRLIEIAPDHYVFVFNHHHIISDGWSTDIIFEELSELYKANTEGYKAKLDILPIQYTDFAMWERSEFKKKYFKNKLLYWKDTLCGYTELQLPTDKPRPVKFSYKGANLDFSLDAELSNKLSKLAKDNDTTLYTLMLSAFNVLLARYSGQKDIVIGSPVANRYHHDTERLVGFFVNTLVLRNEIDCNNSFKQLLRKVSATALSAFENQEVPFEQIVNILRVPRDASRNPIVQVMFSFQSFGGEQSNQSTLKLPNIEINKYSDASYDVAKFDLSLFISKSDNGLSGKFNYCVDLYNHATIERISRNFERLLTAIVENSSVKIKDLRLLTAERRKQILVDWNDTAAPYPKDKTIYKLFEEQAKQAPDNIAVVFEEEKLSYKELNKKSNQLSHLIRAKYKKQNKKDLKPDSLIGLCVERSLDMIIGILGILKAGGAYVPLDPDYPQERLKYMIEDSHEGLIITQNNVVAKDGFLDKLHHDELLVIDSDEVKAELSKQSSENLDSFSGPNDLAYVIYTSGSTGRPKGVMIEHSGVCNLAKIVINNFGIKSKTKVLQFASICFDASVYEFCGTLTCGGSLHLLSGSELPPHKNIEQILLDKEIEIAMLPPALLETVESINLPKLMTVISGGDRLTPEIFDKWSKVCRLINAYGPTESTVCCSMSICEETINIGKAISNKQLYILDNNLNPCPIGAPGELYIGGVGLARGYLNQDKLTKERFVSNPFAKELGLSKSDKIYKTGDLVRWLPDGNIEYLGRTDFQVKIRGYRIELGEIENNLAEYDGIVQVIVTAKEKENQKYLVAYYVIEKNKKDPEIYALRDYLSETLPDYMVPNAFVKLDEMPLTPNGKINRRALPDPDMSLMGEEYVAPRNEIEKKLADVWCDILKVDKVGVHDNFFNLGGNSLLTIKLISKINQSLNLNTMVSWAFKNTTIAEQATSAQADKLLLEEYQPITTIKQLAGSIPLFLVHGGRAGAEVYLDMAGQFKDDNKLISAVYGIESYNLNHLDSPICDLKLLAKKYIQYMKIIQPQGPYFLGGWSLGGSIALEMARQLQCNGENVLSVYLIDTVAQYAFSTPAQQLNEKINTIESPTDHYIQLSKARGASDEYIQKTTKLIPIEQRLFESCLPTALPDIDVVFMNAVLYEVSTNTQVDKLRKKLTALIIKENKCWDKYVKNLKVEEFKADHFSIMKGEHLKRVVEIMENDMQEKIQSFLDSKKNSEE